MMIAAVSSEPFSSSRLPRRLSIRVAATEAAVTLPMAVAMSLKP